jgi:hypothetical protein
VIWTADQGPPPCTPQAQVKEQAQTPPSAPALPAPEQRGETILAPAPAPAPVPSVQEPGRTTVETHTLAESPTLAPAQAPAPTKVQAKARPKARPKPKPKAPEPAGGYWNSGQFAPGLH